MTTKLFNFLLVLLYLKLTYSANFNYLFANISNCEKDPKRIKETIYQFAEESKKFKEGNTFPNQEFIFRNYKNFSNEIDSIHLYTRDYHKGKDPEILDQFNMSSWDNSHLKQKRIYILVHGFGGNGSLEWIINLKDALLKKEDCNVLSFDWPAGNNTGSDGAAALSYFDAMTSVSPVGNATAIFIESIIKHVDLKLDSVHCIGHSLGAHVCGYTGKPLKGRIGRISGLDPAGPLFYDCYPSGRLDKSDAVYVDVIHTDACESSGYCYGIDKTIGHSDFFPNEGLDQPGCPIVYDDRNGCSHSMSYKYFIASLDFNRSSTYFLARPCKDWKQYEEGKCSCGDEFQFMGFYARAELHGSFYLKTSAKAPYAMQDKGCIVVKASDFINTNFFIFHGVCMIMLAVLLIYIVWQRFCCSPTSIDEKPLLGGYKKAF